MCFYHYKLVIDRKHTDLIGQFGNNPAGSHAVGEVIDPHIHRGSTARGTAFGPLLGTLTERACQRDFTGRSHSPVVDSTSVRQDWAHLFGEFSPEYYAYYGANDTSERIKELFDRHLPREATILEVGCSAGRHLAYLQQHGFENLSGIDVNEDSFDVMAEVYPDLAAVIDFSETSIEAIIGEIDDNAFDGVFSVQTLQHIHPEAEWVFDDLVRITDGYLLTAEIEKDAVAGQHTANYVQHAEGDIPIYYRNWRTVFTDRGCIETDATENGPITIRTFRPR